MSYETDRSGYEHRRDDLSDLSTSYKGTETHNETEAVRIGVDMKADCPISVLTKGEQS